LQLPIIGLTDRHHQATELAGPCILPLKEVNMKTEYSDKYYRTTLAALSPIVDNNRQMVGATRHAFNRSSLAALEEARQKAFGK